jgi:hypothetical protein
MGYVTRGSGEAATIKAHISITPRAERKQQLADRRFRPVYYCFLPKFVKEENNNKKGRLPIQTGKIRRRRRRR